MVLRLATHRALEFAIGLALAALPGALLIAGAISDSIWAVAAAMALGLLLATLGAAADRQGRGVDGSAHAAADWALVVVLLVVAGILAATGQRFTAGLMAVAALAQAGLAVTTRYSARPNIRDRSRPTTVTSD